MSHRYAGPWSDVSSDAVEAYLKSYAELLKPIGTELWYIDVFAGLGDREPKRQVVVFLNGTGSEVGETLDGSARRALEIAPPFDHFVFVESDPRRATELARLRAEWPHADIEIRSGGVDAEIRDIVGGAPWSGSSRRGARGVVFLDACSTQVEWSTLQAIAATRRLDVWYLFNISAIARELTLNYTGLSSREKTLDRMLSERWRELHTTVPDPPLQLSFTLKDGWEPVVRPVKGTLSSRQINQWLKNSLQSEFRYVSEPLNVLAPDPRDRLALFLCLATPSAETVELARAFEARVNTEKPT